MHKYILLALALCVANLSISAQRDSKTHFTFFVAGGYSALDYNSSIGKKDKQTDIAIGMDISFYLNENWSVGSGLDMTNFSSRLKANSFEYRNTIKIQDEQYDLESKVKYYKETQKISYLSIPIFLRFDTPVKEDIWWYAQASVMAGISVKNDFRARSTYENLLYTGDTSIKDDYILKNNKVHMSVKAAYRLGAETGLKWSIGEVFYIYTGIYADYGLNNIRNSQDKNLVEYHSINEPIRRNGQSILASQAIIDGEKKDFVASKIRPIAIGFKFRLGFDL